MIQFTAIGSDRQRLVLALFLAFVLASCPLALGQEADLAPAPLRMLLNEEWLEEAWSSGMPGSQSPYVVNFATECERVEDPFTVLAVVLKHLPGRVVVYPSEQYFYFKFLCGERLVSGNLRFCDSSDGVVHFGYFDEFEKSFIRTATLENGRNAVVSVSTDDVVSIEFAGVKREFEINGALDGDLPELVRSGDDFVGGVRDESGYQFALGFNRHFRQFYFVCSPNPGLEPMSDVDVGDLHGDCRICVGLVSRFLFLVDPDAQGMVLVGVLSRNVFENNYFDGPFDQVPPKLAIRDKIESAYPYVRMRGGIDEHGNFSELYGSRVAISPYLQYSGLDDFRAQMARRIDEQIAVGQFRPFLGLTFEEKSRFHELLEKGEGGKQQ